MEMKIISGPFNIQSMNYIIRVMESHQRLLTREWQDSTFASESLAAIEIDRRR